ncbi:low molecular weight phosphatase family protein [Williamsia maris]|uniref:Arsenate-mycothiol transferase n=1 Tax=Williamsia maris TaxID=72806 RepID=A0ABT1HKS9_9NOCA|nr:low molecular weight phosphatase family protein [Williamsia maris]MCP2178562.1 arsenate-mycothiol transferase [Williamsia maris]
MTEHAVPTRSILFVCAKNAGKSQMAAGLMRAAVGDTVEIHSAGTRPGKALNAMSVAALREVGVDVGGEHPKPTDPDLAGRMTHVIVLGREARFDPGPGPIVETWDTDEPSDRGIEGAERMRLIRDDIAARVDDLVARLNASAAQRPV